MVQGVGFRYTTRRIASRFEVAGYVRNLPDGRVLVVAEGRPEEIERFLSAIRQQMRGYVDEERETVQLATGQFRGFEIRH
jgi:acylphosphatase